MITEMAHIAMEATIEAIHIVSMLHEAGIIEIAIEMLETARHFYSH